MTTKVNKILKREDILKRADLKREPIEVPEWGGTVIIREPTGIERDTYEVGLMDKKGPQRGGTPNLNFINARAKLIVLCCIDDDGNRLFQDSDITELSKKSGKAINRLFMAIQELSGMTPTAVERAEENLKTDPLGGSGSA